MEEYKRNDYWNGLEEYNATPQFRERQSKEFKEDLPLEDALSEESLGLKANRRDFLKIFGFGLTAAALSACDTPLKKAIPYVIKPDNVTPGVASWYASTCQGCAAGCGVLVKTREGRPIKIEGNPDSPVGKGGVCSTGQSTVLNLYDSSRMQKPSAPWKEMDAAVKKALGENAGKLVVLSGPINSPVSQKVINDFLAQSENATHVQYSPAGVDAIAKAHQNNFGEAMIPGYNFEKADVIVNFGADFLGTWISPVEFTKGYAQGRRVAKSKSATMSKHYEFESTFSLTGSNADLRVPVDAGAEGTALLNLYNLVAAKKGMPALSGVSPVEGAMDALKQAADSLYNAQGRSLVLSGSNNVALQETVNAINEMLGNYGTTLDRKSPISQGAGSYGDLVNLVKDMAAKSVGTLVMVDVNPAYDYHDPAGFKTALANVKNVISLSYREDESAALAGMKAPINHYLESWDVLEPRKGHFSIVQPTIRPIFDTRQWQESLLAWTPDAEQTMMLDASKTWFVGALYNGSGSEKKFWENAVQTGGYSGSSKAEPIADVAAAVAEPAEEDEEASSSGSDLSAAVTAFGKPKTGTHLVVYQKVGIMDGRWANNPHLQELPDPMTKVVWDNYVTVPYTMAKAQSITDGDIMKVSANGYEVSLPAVVIPAQGANTVGIALGYGRTAGGRVVNGIGQNAYPFAVNAGGQRQFRITEGVTVEKTADTYAIQKTQYYMGFDLRDEGGPAGGEGGLKNIENRIDKYIVKDTTLDQYKDNFYAGNENRAKILHENSMTLWKSHKKKGYHWGMAIDLNSCTGCSACVVACHTENNVPMVGRAEAGNTRDMHWMRIDRYFKGNPDAMDGSLQVAHQPLMCQHCDNAPCETVCPVLATVHSDEGLNQQVYNRCVGTRYCANNCPYKVRRFNWFSYDSNEKFNSDERNAPNGHMFNDVGTLVLNPDVTIRARGVMEKCSMCVQRIQAGKLTAKVERRKLVDGEIKMACQQSCPADAIVFGDLNDKDSAISKHFSNERFYHALEEVKTLPTVGYMTKVRNNDIPQWHETEVSDTNHES